MLWTSNMYFFSYQRKLDLRHVQISCWAKQYIIVKNSSIWPVRHWNHLLMIPLYCLYAKLNACSIWMLHDLILLFFWFCLLTSHERFSCCSIACLCLQMKQVDCKMNTKNANNYKHKTFHITIADILVNAPFKEVLVVITEDDE